LLLAHINDTLLNLTVDGIDKLLASPPDFQVIGFRIKPAVPSVDFQLNGDPKTSFDALKANITKLLAVNANASDVRIGNVTLMPPVTTSPSPSPKQRRTVEDIDPDNEDDWSDSFWVQAKILDVVAVPAPPTGPGITLIVIICVIAAIALIITVVLIITLNRKKQDDYMPVEDLEDDRLLTDTY